MKKKIQKTRRIFKKRPCRLCREKVETVDYKDINFLTRFISDRGRIIPTRLTGNCSRHQRMVASGVKRARLAAFLPFVRIRPTSLRRRRTRERERE